MLNFVEFLQNKNDVIVVLIGLIFIAIGYCAGHLAGYRVGHAIGFRRGRSSARHASSVSK
jgi:hypothetical protein